MVPFPHLTVLANLTLAPLRVKHMPKAEAADTVVSMADGQIVEMTSPAELFGNAKEDRTRQFLSRIIRR